MPFLPVFSKKGPPRGPEPKRLMFLALPALLVCSVLLSLRCGSQSYTFLQFWAAVWGGDTGSAVWRILIHVRIPRTLAGLLAGSALAVAGVLVQGVLNNAMASPNIIGINAGAGFFALLAATLAADWGGLALASAASFLGALSTALLIYFLAVRAGLSRTTLILAGVTVNSILTACTNALSLLYPEAVAGANSFMLGGFSGVTLAALKSAAPYLTAGFLLAFALAVDLNVLQLGEESAAGLGLHVGRVRFLAILAAALLAGAAVSFAGLLGFVGLLVPHIARRFAGSDNRWLLPASALLGGSFVLLCDVLARVLFSPFELPVGIVMSLLGGPFFLYLLLHHKRSRIYD